MKRFIIGLLVLGAIVAVVASIMKRRSGSDVGWDELTQDMPAKASDATERAKDAASGAKDAVADDITVIVEDAERSTS
jgi:hypothetical protein